MSKDFRSLNSYIKNNFDNKDTKQIYINKIKDLIHEKLGTDVLVKQFNATKKPNTDTIIQITTPFLNEVNDEIGILLIQSKKEWFLTDDGETGFELSCIGIDDDNKIKKQIIYYMKHSQWDIKYNQKYDELDMKVSKLNELTDNIVFFIQRIVELIESGQVLMNLQDKKGNY